MQIGIVMAIVDNDRIRHPWQKLRQAWNIVEKVFHHGAMILYTIKLIYPIKSNNKYLVHMHRVTQCCTELHSIAQCCTELQRVAESCTGLHRVAVSSHTENVAVSFCKIQWLLHICAQQ